MLKPFRRFVRFRLSTLLIAVTLLCLWLAMESTRARNQDRVAAMLKRAGATVFFEQRWGGEPWIDDYVHKRLLADGVTLTVSAPAPRWVLNLLGEHFFVRPVTVFVRAAHDKEEMIRGLLTVTSLRQLDLSGITDGDLAGLDRLRELRILNLCDKEVTDESVPHLAKLTTLEKLDLGGTSITPEGFAKLKLLLSDCRIIGDPSSRGAARLAPTPAPVR